MPRCCVAVPQAKRGYGRPGGTRARSRRVGLWRGPWRSRCAPLRVRPIPAPQYLEPCPSLTKRLGSTRAGRLPARRPLPGRMGIPTGRRLGGATDVCSDPPVKGRRPCDRYRLKSFSFVFFFAFYPRPVTTNLVRAVAVVNGPVWFHPFPGGQTRLPGTAQSLRTAPSLVRKTTVGPRATFRCLLFGARR